MGFALAAVLIGALLQSATGTGFAQLAAPALTAVYDPQTSVATLAILGPIVSGLTLGEVRKPQVLGRTAVILTLASVPGMIVGVLVLRHTPVDALRILVAVAVLAGVAATARGAVIRGSAAGPGFLSGVLATSTGLSGPPMVLYLLGHRARPAEVRDTLAAVFLATGFLTILALAVAGLLDPVGHLLLFVGVTVIGQVSGRFVFARLGDRHRAATLGVLVLCALVALVPAVQALT